MPLHIEEFEDPELEETTYTYLLQDDDGKTLVNLSDLMDGNLHDVEDYGDYYVGITFDNDDYECQVLFNEKGQIIISPVIEYTHISGRNEFIVSVNGGNNDECYEINFSYNDTYYGVIDFYGDFIIPPKYTSIEYDETFDLYIANHESYLLNGEYLGDICDSQVDDYLVFEKNNRFGLYNKDGIILEPIYTTIEELGNPGILILKDGNKAGLYNINTGGQPDLKLDEISESFYHEINGEDYYLVRIGNQYGLSNPKMELLFDNLLDGIDESSFSNSSYVNWEDKTIHYTSFIAWNKGKYWNGVINEDIKTTKKCSLSGSGMFPKGYDYLKIFEFDTQLPEFENNYIKVGFEDNRNYRRYHLSACHNNKHFEHEEFRSYPLGVNNELLVTRLEENRFGAFLISSNSPINYSRNAIAIQFIYEELNVIKSKERLVTGLVGKINNAFDIYEPMQFRQIGHTDNYEKALDILRKYYSEI